MTFQATQKDVRTILNRRWRLEHCYKVRYEDRTLGNLDFEKKPAQKILMGKAEASNYRGIRQIDLKDRKQGVSTFWLIFYLDDTIWTPNTTTVVQAHRQDDLEKLFQIIKLAYDTCPPAIQFESGQIWYKPKASYDNRHELVFPTINSSIYIALKVRGGNPNNLHISEAAHIKDEEGCLLPTLASVASRDKGTNITIESTANGIGGWFQETYAEAENGNNEYESVFFPWYEDPSKKLNVPEGWQPTQQVIELAERIKQRAGIEITPEQMLWWVTKKQEQKRLMDQEFPTFAEDAFLVTGNAVFDGERLKDIAPIKPVDHYHGTAIYVPPKPGRKYVIGVDPAEGVGGDRSAIEVYDTLTLEQVAEFVSNKISPPDLAKHVDRIGRFYNNALVAVERNNHGHTVLDRLKDTYGNIYMTQVFDEKTNKKTKKLGWETNSRTRDLILDEFEDLVAQCTVKLNSGIIKEEMITFIVNDDGRREAKTGKHDDAIMASAIALKVARMPRSAFMVFNLS